MRKEIAERQREQDSRSSDLADREQELARKSSDLQILQAALDANKAVLEEAEHAYVELGQRLNAEQDEITRAHEEVDIRCAEHERELADVARSQVERDRKHRRALTELESREAALAAREFELETAWRGIEASALERIEAERMRRRVALEEHESELATREHDLLLREQALWAQKEQLEPATPAPDLDPHPTSPVLEAIATTTDDGEDAKRRPVAPTGSGHWSISALAAAVSDGSAEHAEREEEWRAHLDELREYANAAGLLPLAFDSLIRETFDVFMESEERNTARKAADA